MKKFIKLISFVMIAVLCVGSTVFAADLKAYSGTYQESSDFSAGFYSVANTSYFNVLTSGAKISASALNKYTYFVVELAVKPTTEVTTIYLADTQSAMSKRATIGWNPGEWNKFKYIFDNKTVDEKGYLQFTVSTYINGKYIERNTYSFGVVPTDTTVRQFRFYVGQKNAVEYATIKSYATDTAPDVVSSEKIINDNYVIDGSKIYVKSGITTADALCKAVIGGKADSVQAMVMPKGKNAAGDYTDADTHNLADGDTLAVRTLQSGTTYKKSVYTINLDKPVVVLSGDAISTVRQNYSDGYTSIDDTKALKVTAYAKDGGKVYLAQYDADGALLSAQAQDVTAGTFASIDFAKAENMSTVKTFLWNNTSFAPLCSTQILKPVSGASTAE